MMGGSVKVGEREKWKGGKRRNKGDIPLVASRGEIKIAILKI